MAYTTQAAILDKIGVTTDEISTEILARILSEAEAEVNRIMKTTCTPKVAIKTFTGNNKATYYLKYLPVLVVKKVVVNDTSLDLNNVVYNPEGNVTILTTSEDSYFYYANSPNCSIKFYYGWLEEDLEYSLDGDVLSGDDITVTLDNVTDLTAGDWIKIMGTDGYEEWTKIKTIHETNPTITCDLIYSHESGSIVYSGGIPDIIVKLTAVIGAIMGGTYMMGSTYTFATSYSVPDHSVTKGVPYPHFVRVLDELVKERDFLIKQLPPFPVFA